MWQIAQRDYKFGKGKHSSLTKATYDAVANRFRALWGKEAGWAHSVLFTADLKTFSERLIAKTEAVTSNSIAKDEGDVVIKVDSTVETKAATKVIKRELEDHEHQVLEVSERVVRRTKRRRRSEF